MEPRTYTVLVSPKAFDDLDAIVDYVADRSPENAAKLIDRLWNATQGLREFPQRCTIASGTRRTPDRAVRRLPVLPHVIYFRVDESARTVRILRILHGRQRRPRRFE